MAMRSRTNGSITPSPEASPFAAAGLIRESPSRNARTAEAAFVIPTNYFHAGTLHIILAVTDGGLPALTRYRRVILTVAP